MLTYSFSDIGNCSLYEYLYKCIKKDITNGTLPNGYKLPSKRSFAKNLNISTITIENAYAQLMAEGYIYSKPKKGYFVSDVINNQEIKPPNKIINNINTKEMPDFFADFVSNKTIYDNFPFSIWSKLMREVMTSQSELLMTNPPPGGTLQLRQAIADHLYQFRGMHVSPEQIIIGAGTEYLYGLLIQLLGHDNIFAVEDPGYKKISQIYASNNIPCRFVSLDKNGIHMDSLNESGADIIHISPSHHYPTGIITPISRRYELLSWASLSPKRYIIEDDYDCEFRLLGKPIPTMQSIDAINKVIYINTFTKSLASTIRISYMVLPQNLLDLYYTKLGFYSCTVSNFEQLTLALFINEGYFEKHINRMRNFYRNQRDLLLEEIKKSPLNPYCTIKEQDSGLHFLIEINTELSDNALIKKAAALGLGIAFISQYYQNQETAAKHIIIMNYSGINTEKIPKAIDLLCKSILE